MRGATISRTRRTILSAVALAAFTSVSWAGHGATAHDGAAPAAGSSSTGAATTAPAGDVLYLAMDSPWD